MWKTQSHQLDQFLFVRKNDHEWGWTHASNRNNQLHTLWSKSRPFFDAGHSLEQFGTVASAVARAIEVRGH